MDMPLFILCFMGIEQSNSDRGGHCILINLWSEAYSEPCKTPKTKLFVKIVKDI